MKRCLIKEMQIKTTMRYHFIPTRMTMIEKSKIVASVGEDVEKSEHSYLADGDVKWYSHFENSLLVPQKVKHRVILPSNSTPRYMPREMKTLSTHKTCMWMFIAALSIIAPEWKQ